MDGKKVGAEVKQYLKSIDLSQREVATALDMFPETLNRMLQGRSGFLPKNWRRLLAHLGLELRLVKKGAKT